MMMTKRIFELSRLFPPSGLQSGIFVPRASFFASHAQRSDLGNLTARNDQTETIKTTPIKRSFRVSGVFESSAKRGSICVPHATFSTLKTQESDTAAAWPSFKSKWDATKQNQENAEDDFEMEISIEENDLNQHPFKVLLEGSTVMGFLKG